MGRNSAPARRATRPVVEPGRGHDVAVGAVSLNDGHGGGLNRFTETLVSEMVARHPGVRVFTTSRRMAARCPDEVVPVRTPGVADGSFRGNLARLLWHQALLPAALRRQRAGVFFSTVAEGMLRPPCPQVVTLHDVIPLVYPELFARLDLLYRHWLPRVIRASSALVVMSEATRRDVERYYAADVEGRPIHVVYQGYRRDVFRTVPPAAVEEVRKRHGLGRYVLAVGETRPYKNVRRLVEAFARGKFGDTQLAIVGRAHKDDPHLGMLPRTLGVEQRVRFLGFVPDGDLAALYGGAEAFVFPSLYEGFGIPVLEAMACGCPVVCSSAASLPEVCGDAAVYVDPRSTDAIAGGLATVLGDDGIRATLRERGIERVRRFSYADAADQVMNILAGVRQ